MSKVVVVGAGLVGSTIAYALMLGGTAEEITLIDKIDEKPEPKRWIQSLCIICPPGNHKSRNYKECSNADIVIITAGASETRSNAP